MSNSEKIKRLTDLAVKIGRECLGKRVARDLVVLPCEATLFAAFLTASVKGGDSFLLTYEEHQDIKRQIGALVDLPEKVKEDIVAYVKRKPDLVITGDRVNETAYKMKEHMTPPVLLYYIIENMSDGLKQVIAESERKSKKELGELSDMSFDELFESSEEYWSTQSDDGSEVDEFLEMLDEVFAEDEGESGKGLSCLTERARAMQKALSEKVIGQDHAIYEVVSGYFRSELSMMTDEGRTRPATFLFAGSPGVGKTFLAESFAEHLDRPFKRFDMSEYGDQEGAIEFCGSDTVYSGAKSGNFTSFVSQHPRCVVLFDEIEKAHASVIHLFLQMLDAGRIRDSYTDKEISLKDAVLIFTTNAGKQLYEGEERSDLSGISRRVILKALERDVDAVTGKPYFPAAICSRFASGNVILFNKIGASSLCALAKREIVKNAEGLKNKLGIEITVDSAVYPTVLFAEGGRADARSVKGRAAAFFNDELYEFFRLVSGNGCGSLEDVESIRFEVELPDDRDLLSLYRGDGNECVLAVTDGSTLEEIEKMSPDGVSVLHGETVKAVDDAIRKRDVKAVLVDLNYQRRQSDGEYLNTEDIDSKGRKIFHHLREKYPSLPVYMLESNGLTLRDEERQTFLRLGAFGFVNASAEKDEFSDSLRAIMDDIRCADGVNALDRSNRLVTFETAQKLSKDKKRGVIRLFDLKAVTAIDAEDTESVMSGLCRPELSLEDVIGAAEAKKELSYFIRYLKEPKKYASKGVRAPRGVLLYGPSGVGKTMLARAMAGESSVTFITAEGNQFLKRYVGEGPKKVHELFRTARKYAPSILFIDEIDAVGRIRTGETTGAEETLTALLTEMDGFNTDPAKPVFILAATNYGIDGRGSRSLDPALVRRFDRKIFVDLPDRDDRVAFLNKRLGSSKSFDVADQTVSSLAIRSTGMSLSQLADIVELSLRSAISDGGATVTDELLEEAFESYEGGSGKGWDAESLRRVAIHESGHAYICYRAGNMPSYITVVARGGRGGYVQGAGNEDKRIYTRAELLSGIRAALGGRAAEIVYYGRSEGVSTSVASDLEKATEVATELVCRYGMDEEYGISVTDPSRPDVKAAVDRILAAELEAAIMQIEEGRATLECLCDALINKNRLGAEEIRALLESEGK